MLLKLIYIDIYSVYVYVPSLIQNNWSLQYIFRLCTEVVLRLYRACVQGVQARQGGNESVLLLHHHQSLITTLGDVQVSQEYNFYPNPLHFPFLPSSPLS